MDGITLEQDGVNNEDISDNYIDFEGDKMIHEAIFGIIFICGTNNNAQKFSKTWYHSKKF